MNEVIPPLDARSLTRGQQLRIVLILVVLLVVGTGVAWIAPRVLGNNANKPAAPAKVSGTFKVSDAQLAGFQIAEVSKAVFRSQRTTEGKIALNSDAATPVFSPYSGRVTQLVASLGDSVKKGAPLFALEASEFVQAQSDLANATAQLELAKVVENRKHASYDAKGASLQDWQQSQAELTAAQAALSAVRNRLRIFGKSDAEIDALARVQKPDPVTYVVAPISGVVTDRQIGLGQYLQAGAATPVYMIGDLSRVWLVANVREMDAPLIRVGQPIEVQVLALPNRTFKAKISYVAPSVDPATRRIGVRAAMENPNGVLKPEMFASFDIITGDAADGIGVPEAALIYEGEAARVWVVRGNDLALQPVHIGRNANGIVEVTEGLKPGDRVITGGSLFIDRAARPE